MYFELNELKELLDYYQDILHKASKLKYIAGTLSINKTKTSVKYYHNFKEDKKLKKKYIPNRYISKARLLAQKSYNKKVIKILENRIKLIKKLLKNYSPNEIENEYKNLSKERKDLVIPLVTSYEDDLIIWKSKEYNKKEFYNDYNIILTNKGERVRSKSEKILADTFNMYNLDYKYECPINLKNGLTFYPDFTFLSPKTGKEIYYEHFGMMDSPEYSRKAIKKIETYEKNGISLGKDLLVTFETSDKIFDINWIFNKLSEHFDL